uniref:Ribonuclease E n=1 Tax=Acrosorium ciliolatum TaxID=1550622 RepID=A0A1Z1M203_9FLOR|nr:ribonuclease E [Acrosorium ciliolatum]ARW59920.1 ribonuclease E [Acrosorium ciliolatum]
MVKKIIISYFNNLAAIVHNNKIEEILVVNQNYQVNDIYIGIVQKIFSSINAAFIKLGQYGKSGFIHLSDIKFLKRSKYINHINEILSINQRILVQIVKEPTVHKGPRLTANIHLHGKYLILMPFCNIISVSNKIHDDNERTYLYSLSILMKPEMMGLLVKPSAKGVSEKVILQDLDCLKKQWYFIEKVNITKSSPFLIYKDEDLIKRIVRDFYEQSIKKIIVDSEDGLKLLYYYLSKWDCISPITNIELQLYNKSECILEEFYVKKTIKEALKPKVNLLSGGYIVIENYEALTIIDVNSGSFNKSGNSKETILRTNFYAAIEIAYQLRVRNINGVIIIDFIDMHSQRDQLQLLEHFNRLLKFDNSKPQIVQLSELGLVELTRRRRSQSLQEIFGNLDNKQSNFKLYLSNQLYSGLSINNSNQNLGKHLLSYKNIRSLFFNKQFSKNILLEYKFFHSCMYLYHKYFISIDEINTIYFFNPKANYIVPLDFYFRQIKFE